MFMDEQMVEKRSKTDIAMLIISAVLTAWLSVLERIRETTTETGEAYVSKTTMFWLDIIGIVISALLTIFGSVEVGQTEKEIKRSRSVDPDETDVEVYIDPDASIQSEHDEGNLTQHQENTQINSFSTDNRTINNITINVNTADLSQTMDMLNDLPSRNELYDQRLNESLSRLNKSYSHGNLTFSNHSMERPTSAQDSPGFLAPRVVETHPHSFPNDTFERSNVTFSLPGSCPNHVRQFSSMINQNANDYSDDTYDYSEDYSEEETNEEEALLTNEEEKRSSSKSL